MKALILTAYHKELDQFANYFNPSSLNQGVFHGEINNQHVGFASTGIGLVNAAISTTKFLTQHQPDFIFFSGIAGSLDPNLAMGDIVVGTHLLEAELINFIIEQDADLLKKDIAWPEPMLFPDDSLISLAKKIINTNQFPAKLGGIVSTDFFPKPPYLPATINHYSLDAIDMESFAFTRACQVFNKPNLVVRSMSNVAGDSLHDEIIDQDIFLAAKNAARFVVKLIENL